MSTLHAFNALLRAFIEELAHTFPEDATLAVSLTGLDTLIKANARKPLQLFMEAVSAHAQLILSKDPTLFDQPITLPGALDLKKYWDSPGLSDASKDGIWGYIQQLYLLGSTVSALPPEMLGAIESMAQQCASKIESGEADLSSITSMLLGGNIGGLAGMLGGGEANPLAALLGSQSPPSSSSSRRHTGPTKKKSKK
jgi:hypothetical protein